MSFRTVEVGPCEPADLPQLFGLALTAFGTVPGWSDQRVVETLIADMIFVAREGGRPVGYVALGRDEEGRLLVDQILVAPGHEQRGIGRRLLLAAEEFACAEGDPSLGIAVEEGNWAARSFYRRSGFVPIAPERFELRLPRH
jgi:ribosomal protein S18 acetylase RimI-like enzyme